MMTTAVQKHIPTLTMVELLAMVAVVLIVAYVLFGRAQSNQSNQSFVIVPGYEAEMKADGAYIPTLLMPTAPQHEQQVVYVAGAFVPKVVVVTKGDTVIFKNGSEDSFWPVSSGDSIYPGAGSCGGSAFDACRAIAPNQSWPFTFTQTGTWNYADHSDPAINGIIVVQ